MNDDSIEVGGLVNTDTGRDQLTVACSGGEVRVDFFPPMVAQTLAELAAGNGGGLTPTAILTLSPVLARGFAGLLNSAAQVAADDSEDETNRPGTTLVGPGDPCVRRPTPLTGGWPITGKPWPTARR